MSGSAERGEFVSAFRTPESIVSMKIYSPAWLEASAPRSRTKSRRRGLWRLILRFLSCARN